jgi:valyl-tRNA synthetase
MHPDDKRYARYKDGETFEAEWINGKIKATIVKDSAVDPEFGTGVMTITPWHDLTDFEIAERHGLEREQIIDYSGKLLPIAGEFAGQSIQDARPKIVEKMRAKGLLIDVDESYVHNLALNSRGKGVIEPQIMLQWFVDVNRPAMEWKGQMRSLKEVMRAVIEDGDIELIPKRFEKVYYHWIDNLRDWCISRQIWWGHQIPVWYKNANDEVYVGVVPPESDGWKQDPDTLDTWFSSALWTWSTLIDPELAKDYSLSLEEILGGSIDFKTYHPTSVMETGWDILFFWVSRMILATTYVTGEIPFKTVYLHGLVRTETGKKMSKSSPETTVDPTDVIPKYGTDALRLALISGTGAGNDQRLGVSKIVANRNFCNKLWNIARYIEGVVGESSREEVQPKSDGDHWILNKLSISAEGIAKDLENFRFAEAYETLYHFIWDDFADWYVEASKVNPNQPLLAYVLEQTLKLAHPFAPFLTETIWGELGWNQDSMLIGELWPKVLTFDPAQANHFDQIKSIVSEIRWLNAISGTRAQILYCQDAVILDNSQLVAKLAGLKEVKQTAQDYSGGLRLTSAPFDAWLDTKPNEVKDSLADKLKEYGDNALVLKNRLDKPGYRDNAPEELVAQSEEELSDAQAKADQLRRILDGLKG